MNNKAVGLSLADELVSFATLLDEIGTREAQNVWLVFPRLGPLIHIKIASAF